MITDQIQEELKSLVDGEDVPIWFSSDARRVEMVCVEMKIYSGEGFVKFRVVRLEGSGVLCNHYMGGYGEVKLGSKHLISAKSLIDLIKSRNFGGFDAVSDGSKARLVGVHNFSVSCEVPCEIEVSGSIYYDINYPVMVA
jgi:hypothetical protein